MVTKGSPLTCNNIPCPISHATETCHEVTCKFATLIKGEASFIHANLQLTSSLSCYTIFTLLFICTLFANFFTL